MEPSLQWLVGALDRLHSLAGASFEQRQASDAALLQFQRSDAAWGICLHLLTDFSCSPRDNSTSSSLLWFAAQTLRTKVNEQGISLSPAHLEQLKQCLLQQLMRPDLPIPLLRQLCLALASTAALLPSWEAWLQPVGSSLPWRNAVQLMHDVAEEGISDWRHVVLPGMTSSEKLCWATTTRDRFRAWSPEALQVLLSLLQQQQQQGVVCILEGLTAWVKLGALHLVPQHLAAATADTGLTCIQSPHAEVVEAAAALLSDLPEYAPEQLLHSLEPHMLQVAAAALQAASGHTCDGMHVAAWVAAFSAYVAALPDKLVASGDVAPDTGHHLRQALLQVSALVHIHNMQPICLPALQVWAAALGSLHTRAAAAASPTSVSRDLGALSSQRSAGDIKGHAAPEAAAASETEVPAALQPASCVVPNCITSACHQLLLQTALSCTLWVQVHRGTQAEAEAEASFSPEAASAVQELFSVVECIIGLQHYLEGVLLVWGGQKQQQTHRWWQDPALQQLVQGLTAAPGSVRLQVAVTMAAAVAVQPLVYKELHEEALTNQQEASSSISGLLFSAVWHMSSMQHPASSADTSMVLILCRALQVWSSYLVHHLMPISEDQGAAGFSSLLQLLLSLTQAYQHDADVRIAAAAAVRALSCSAMCSGWGKLRLGTPALLQVVQSLSGADAADQDLLASLSMCLATVCTSQQDLQELKASSCQALVQPAVDHLVKLLQVLQDGQHWQEIADAADAQLCWHLARVRVVLEALWHRQQQERHRQGLQACAGDRPVTLQPVKSPDCCTWPAGAAASDMDQTEDLGGSPGNMLANKLHAQLDMSTCDRQPAAAARGCLVLEDPAIQCVLMQLLPLLHALVVQHAAAGGFLQQHAKCCSKLLKLDAMLLVQPPEQFWQFLEVSVLGLVKQGGCRLAEPLLGVMEFCCDQHHGSQILLQSAPCINKALAQLWSLPEVVRLQQPGHGDAEPDLAETVLKLSSAFIRCNSALQPNSAQLQSVASHVIAAAACCARCSHKRVGSQALSALLAVLDAAVTAAPLLQVVANHGSIIAAGALGALLVPSPLPRLQKASNVLLDLAALAQQVQEEGLMDSGRHTCPISSRWCAQDVAASNLVLEQQQQQMTPLPGFSAGAVDPRSESCTQSPPATMRFIMQSWLNSATQSFTPDSLAAHEAAALATTCAAMLTSTRLPNAARVDVSIDASNSSGTPQHAMANRSYVAARKLKKRLRDFAERHMRTCAPSHL